MGDLVAERMLSMAEYFRQRNEIKKALKMALGAKEMAQSEYWKILTVHQAGKLFHLYTLNNEEAEKFLEVAYSRMVDNSNPSASMFEPMREYRLEAACMLAETYIAKEESAKVLSSFYRIDFPDSKKSPIHHCRLGLLCAEAAMHERKIETALQILDQLTKFVEQFDSSVAAYFAMTRLLVTAHMLGVLPQDEMNIASTALANVTPNHINYTNLQMYFMSIQLAHFLQHGQVRTAKSLLRAMQAQTQNKMSLQGIRWGDATYVTAITCLLTQLTCVQHCSLERASKYYQHAIKHVAEYGSRTIRPLDMGVSHAMRRIRLVAEETMAQSHIVCCQLDLALNNLRTMAETMVHHPSLQAEFVPRMHLILGLLCLYIEDDQSAEMQMAVAAQQCTQFDSWFSLIADCNRALLALTQVKQAEFYEVAERLTPNRCADAPSPIRAMARFMHAFHSYLNGRLPECKTRVSEVLDLTRAEDMFRMHTLAILLCSALNAQFANIVDTLRPTIDWSTKAHDVAMLLWTNSQITTAYDRSNCPNEAYEYAELLKGNFTALVDGQKSLRGHPSLQLVKWLGTNVEDIVPKDDLYL